MAELTIQTSAVARRLMESGKRYLVLYGGRGGGKSYIFADMMIAHLLQERIRAVVCRELKTTISDSVHRLLKDRIDHYNLQPYFVITENSIVAVNGSELTYKHLHDNVTEVKGLQGCDIAWIFEAEKIEKDSFDILDPTIRRTGDRDPQIWIEFNPRLAIDYVYDRFVTHSDPDACVIKINYTDNPWCPRDQQILAERCHERSEAEYRQRWLGEPSVLGLHFKTFEPDALSEEPHNVPEDCLSTVFGSLDHGIAHYTSFGLWYINGNDHLHRIQSYYANGGTTAGHANAIYDMVQGCRFTNGQMPAVIVYDPSMATKRKLSEMLYRSDIDEYIDVFKQRSAHVRFQPANNRKEDGCHCMKQMFDNYTVSFFDGRNKSFVDGILTAETDENNIEIYQKQDGDDACDEARYGMVYAQTVIGELATKRADAIKREQARKQQRIQSFAAVDCGWMA